jgi:hypothetical protein
MIMLASLVVSSPVFAFVHSLVAHLMVMEHAISSWSGFGILVYLGGCTCGNIPLAILRFDHFFSCGVPH